MSSIPFHRGRSMPRLGALLAWAAWLWLSWSAWELAPDLAPAGLDALRWGLIACLGPLVYFTRRMR